MAVQIKRSPQRLLKKDIGVLVGGKFYSMQAGMLSELAIRLTGELPVTKGSGCEALVTMSVPPGKWVVVRGLLNADASASEYTFEFDHLPLAVRRLIRGFISSSEQAG